MPDHESRPRGGTAVLLGGICGLLLACGLAIGDFVRSYRPAKPVLQESAEVPEPAVPPAAVSAWEAVVQDWPAELPLPAPLPRPINLERFVDSRPAVHESPVEDSILAETPRTNTRTQ